jgi:hypothetical protein
MSGSLTHSSLTHSLTTEGSQMNAQGKARSAVARKARLSAPLPSRSLTLADVKADEALVADALNRLTLAHLAPLRSIAESESQRLKALRLSPDEVMTEALRRLITHAPATVAALTTEAAGEAHAHFRMTARSVVSHELDRMTVKVSAAEAERERSVSAALKADGSAERVPDETRREALSLAGSLARAPLASGSLADEAESDARRAEARRFKRMSERETDHSFRLIRETSLERLMLAELRFSAPLTLTTESAGRAGSSGVTLSALTETTERERFREALSLSAEALRERAASGRKAEAEVLTALADVLTLTASERASRFKALRLTTEASERKAEADALALAALKADASQRGNDGERKRLARVATASARVASREREALTLALRLALPERLSLLVILDASVSATGDMSQRESERRKEHSVFSFRSLAEYATQRKADDASLKRWRNTLAALIGEAETLAGYVGTDRETLARWRSESVKAETETLKRAAQRASDEGRRKAEREAPAHVWTLSGSPLDAFTLDASGSVALRPLAEREALAAQRSEREALRLETLTTERLRKAEAEATEALAALAEAEAEAVSRWLAEALAPAARLSLSADHFRSLSEDERTTERSRWLMLAATADAPECSALAGSLAEALAARNYLSAEAHALALRSLERESVSFKRSPLTLAPLTLAAPPLAESIRLAGGSALSEAGERAARAEAQRLTLAAGEAERLKVRSVVSRKRSAEARERYRASGSAARLARREAGERYRLTLARREAEAEALAESLSASGSPFSVVSEAQMSEAGERASERRKAGERPLTLKARLASLSEAEAEATEFRRLILSERTEALKAERREPEALAQRLTLAADAHALRLALTTDERRAGARGSLARRSADERKADGEAQRWLARLAGGEAGAGAEALAARRKA